MAAVVDWMRLGAAVARYRSLGYRYVEAPWVVPRAVTSITCPWSERIMDVPGHGDLVGSAEQSFLALDMDGKLPRGRYVACTPCFRNEPTIDRLHQLTFMKVELYRTDRVDDAALREVISDATGFFAGCLADPASLLLEQTEEGFDLTVQGVEVGSYGLRQHGSLAWVYGTGLAEPRFSLVSTPTAGR